MKTLRRLIAGTASSSSNRRACLPATSAASSRQGSRRAMRVMPAANGDGWRRIVSGQAPARTSRAMQGSREALSHGAIRPTPRFNPVGFIPMGRAFSNRVASPLTRYLPRLARPRFAGKVKPAGKRNVDEQTIDGRSKPDRMVEHASRGSGDRLRASAALTNGYGIQRRRGEVMHVKEMKIDARPGTGLIGALLLLCLAVTAGACQVSRAFTGTHTITTVLLPGIETLDDIQANANRVRRNTLRLTLITDPAARRSQLDRRSAAIAALNRDFSQYEQMIGSPRERERYDRIRQSWTQYLALDQQAVDASEHGGAGGIKARELAGDEAPKVFAAMLLMIEQGIQSRHQDALAEFARAQQRYHEALLLAGVLGVASLLMGGGAGVWVRRKGAVPAALQAGAGRLLKAVARLMDGADGITRDPAERAGSIVPRHPIGISSIVAKPLTFVEFASAIRTHLPVAPRAAMPVEIDPGAPAGAAMPALEAAGGTARPDYASEAAIDDACVAALYEQANDEMPDLARDVVAIYLSSSASQVAALTRALEYGALHYAARLAHTLEASSAYVGALGFAALMKHASQQVRLHDLDAAALARHITAVFTLVQANLFERFAKA
ncbi:MCP four helix bundle domain-containing protein [Burkholderia plantarii]|uniref:MCP four helix bundle domain-containing protein n=1 Tax=Burkholderia plantarii TaxID=41899 RepID=UPI0009F67FA1|nr:MCP four helix bundle domain-containing protein [Burkholderia plantarii]